MTGRERARANALALRANGLSVRQVAERLGVPKGTVAAWLRGRGEWYELRECALCGERFIAASGPHRFCTPAHADKYRRVFGPSARGAQPDPLDGYRQRARELAIQLAGVRAELEARRAA